MMIYTITLNPALDRTLWIKNMRDDVSNRILEEKSFAGGKSVDVSKVLKNLGQKNVAAESWKDGCSMKALRPISCGFPARPAPIS